MKAIGQREWIRCELLGVAARQVGRPGKPPPNLRGQQVEAWMTGWESEDEKIKAKQRKVAA